LIALITIVPYLFPELALAATSEQQAEILQINTQNSNENSLTIDSILANDPLVIKLNEFLEAKNSPLAGSAAEIIQYPHWQLALSISVVESNMCRFTPKVKTKNGWIESYNCSGITLSSGYKMYDNYLGWFADMNTLLSKPNYVNRPIDKFIGYYVVPGHMNWLNGVKKTMRSLATIENEAIAERQNLAINQFNSLAAANNLLTFAEKAN
jgi:hypothetical protein